MLSTVSSIPIEPHIPDEATVDSVRELLELLDFGIAYYQQSEPVPMPAHMPTSLGGPPGQAFKLEPVMGIYWKASRKRDLDVATVYIDGKPYRFAATWVQAAVQRQDKEAHDARGANRTLARPK